MSARCASPIAALRAATRIIVVIPARNEAAYLGAALHALTSQVDFSGRPMPNDAFEIVVFANNCTDRTAAIAREHQNAAPHIPIHVIERDLRPDEAHVGTARRAAMDIAAARFLTAAKPGGIIATTDSDTVVDGQWIAWTLREAGAADAVAGHVTIAPADRARLLAPVRLLYARELTYRRLLAHSEALLDPLPEDPLPRHGSFVGASFAVTAQAYVAAGGLPPRCELEDYHFARALRRIDARIRHSPAVRATTSARLQARVEGGFGSFIAHLHDRAARGQTYSVDDPRQSIAAIALRAALRRLWQANRSADVARADDWRHVSRSHPACRELLNTAPTFGVFHERVTASVAAPAERTVPIDVAIDMLPAVAQRYWRPRPGSGDLALGSGMIR